MSEYKCYAGNYSVAGMPSDAAECVANIRAPLNNATVSCIREVDVALRLC